MKCFYEPEKEAVGVCTYCGRALCAGCLVQRVDQLFCRQGCYIKHEKAHTTVELERMERQMSILQGARSSCVAIVLALPLVIGSEGVHERGVALSVLGILILLWNAYRDYQGKNQIKNYRLKQDDIIHVELLIESDSV